MNLIEQLEQHFTKHVQDLFVVSKEQLAGLQFELNTDPHKTEFGDISTNIAMILAKQLKANPRALAEKIATTYVYPQVEKIELAGPGFINIFLKPTVFAELARELVEQKEQFFKPKLKQPQKYNLEFVSANPTGPLHLGHGRGGIIGDVLGNILRFIGNTTCKEYYINDAGAQIQKLGQSFKARYMQKLGLDAEIPEGGYQGEYLVELAEQALKEYDRELLEKPESFFDEYAKNHMLEYIKQTLTLYGIQFDEWFSEKSLHESSQVPKAITLLTERGHTYEEGGALWFRSTTFGDDKDRVLKRANGEYTYAAADAALLLNKIKRGFDHLIMILGQDHHSYVVRLKGMLQALGHNPDMLDVILYQLVTIKESGQALRLSKRAGRIVTLRDIIQEVGCDVARFFYLNKKADAHLDFDLDLALKTTEENPVFYVQYAFVRTGSILKKAEEHKELAAITVADAQFIGHEEAELIKKILSLKDLLYNISKNYHTHLLTYYVIELATTFHRYYSKHRVIDTDAINQSRGRLLLTKIVQETLALCLDILEIKKPESM